MKQINCQRLERSVGSILWLAAVISLILVAGCSQRNEQDGDPDAKLARYAVTINPYAASINPDVNIPITSKEFSLNVNCVGEILPPHCDDNIPNWSFKKPPGTDFLKIEIPDANRANAHAEVTLDTKAYIAQYGQDATDPTSIGEHWFEIGFFPTALPFDVTVSGNRDVILTITRVRQDAAPRQEQTPEDPNLSAVPEALDLRIGPDPVNTVQSGTLTYSGPATKLLDASITGSGRTKFHLDAPSIGVAFQAGQSRLPFTIIFSPGKLDFARYDAALNLKTENGAFVRVELTGMRIAF